jgi:type 1 glutamine amidotransferase
VASGRLIPLTLWLTGAALLPAASCTDVRHVGTVDRPIQVLVWNNALEFGHASRVNAIRYLTERAAMDNIVYDLSYARTELPPQTPEGTSDPPSFDASVFTDASLDRYDVVFFLHTTGNTIDDDQKDVRRQALHDFIEKKGRGFVGTHSATDTYQNAAWPWYVDFIGANYMTMSPRGGYIAGMLQPAQDHAILTEAKIPNPWSLYDEWFVFDRDPLGVKVLLNATDQQTSTVRPSAWVKEIPTNSPGSPLGRLFYTACCHDSRTFDEDDSRVIGLIVAGIKWAAHRL